MKECKIDGCNSTELVYSGVDAFCLGVPTETIAKLRQLFTPPSSSTGLDRPALPRYSRHRFTT